MTLEEAIAAAAQALVDARIKELKISFVAAAAQHFNVSLSGDPNDTSTWPQALRDVCAEFGKGLAPENEVYPASLKTLEIARLTTKVEALIGDEGI